MSTTPDSGSTTTRDTLAKGTLVAAVLACFLAQYGVSSPAVINGAINADLHTSSTVLTWVSDAFMVPVTLFELSFGVLGDLFGRKRLLAIGSLLMVVGGFIAFLTPYGGTGVLLTGQVLSGLGAAALFPTSIAMIAHGTHSVRSRAHGISMWAAALTTGGFVSPVIGGALAKLHHSGGEEASWRYGFLALAAVALISTIVTLLFAKNSSAPAGRSLDWPGQITVAVGLFALIYGVVQGSEDGWTNPLVITAFVVAVLFLAAFIVVERKVAKPLLQLDLFANRMFVVSAIVTVLAMFAYLGTAYATSIRISSIQGQSPLFTSIGFVLLNIMGVLIFPVSTKMIERFNPGMVLAVGALLIGVGDLWLAAVPATNLSLWAIAIPLLITGAGFKTAVTAITVVAVNSVPTSKAGMASGTTSMLRDFGLTLGPAIVGAIALTHAGNAIASKVDASASIQAGIHKLPADLQHAVSTPLGANAIPSPPNPVKDIAFQALSDAYQIGFLVCGLSAIVAAVIAAVMLRKNTHQDVFAEEEALSEAG